MNNWRPTCIRVIRKALEEGRLNGLTGMDLERHVSAAYPFGKRAMWPYKIWLKTFREMVRGGRTRADHKARLTNDDAGHEVVTNRITPGWPGWTE